jgi:cardiolipin synthase
VEMYEYAPTMMHNKLLIADGQLVSLGSTNFDLRSFQINDEASLNVYDQAFAGHMTKVFEADLALAQRYTLQTWQQRPWSERMAEWFTRPIKTQL